MRSNHLRRSLAVILALLVMAPVLAARNKKAEKYLKQGQVAEGAKKYDEALEWFEKASALDPNDPAYLLAVRRARFEASSAHVDRGMKARKEGRLEEAVTEFQTAILKDPSSAIALQEWRRTFEMLEREKRTGKALYLCPSPFLVFPG